jgi:ubiquinone/menaquinone biosynthesis C-methylase UbiE
MAIKNASRSRWVLQWLAPRPGERILEVGFGAGADIARMLRAVGPAGVVTGVDLSDVMVRLATKRNRVATAKGRAVLREGTVDGLPFPDLSFDGIYSVNSAQFWPDLPRGFRELHRVARPGARAVVAVQPKHRGASAVDSEKWLSKLGSSAQSASWTVHASELGPQDAPVAAVILHKGGA